MILVIDPGRRPGYVLLDPSQLVRRAHLPGFPELPLVVGVWLALPSAFPRGREVPPTHIVCEGQFGKISDKKRRSILTLANEAGWQLHAARSRFGGARTGVCIVHPQALARTDAPGWRDALRCTYCTKEVVQNRVERSLTPTEASLFRCASTARMGDCLDATAIGWGTWTLHLPEWSPPP